MSLPACKWRGEPKGGCGGDCACSYACSSPFLIVGAAGVSAEFCASCRYADRDLPPRLAAMRDAAPASRAGGPGSELKALLASLGFAAAHGPGCQSRAARMDALGVAGCRERSAEIAGWLREQAASLGWWPKFKAGVLAAASGLALNPLDPAKSLLEEAIRRAERKAVPS